MRLPNPPHRVRSLLGLILLTIGLLNLGGCSTGPHGVRISGFNVPDKAALDAQAIVDTMRQAGITDENIIEHGPALRNALATQGGARIQNGTITQAMFIVRGDDLYAVAIDRGAFYYDLLNMRVRKAVASPEEFSSEPTASASETRANPTN